MAIFAFDFDGVICDSAYETGMRAWEGLCTINSTLEKTPSETTMQRWYEIRPVLEKGWQSIILMDIAAHSDKTLAEISQHWEQILQKYLTKYNLTQEQLHALHYSRRQWWIENDLKSWIAEHKFYPGVVDKIKSIQNKEKIIIITTKSLSFTQELLNYINLNIADEDLFAYETNRSKEDILEDYLDHCDAQNGIYFFEDRLLTLQRVLNRPKLKNIKLYLVDWGYNDAEEREKASNLGIEIISNKDFLELPLN